jgi:hypothetical protein
MGGVEPEEILVHAPRKPGRQHWLAAERLIDALGPKRAATVGDTE